MLHTLLPMSLRHGTCPQLLVYTTNSAVSSLLLHDEGQVRACGHLGGCLEPASGVGRKQSMRVQVAHVRASEPRAGAAARLQPRLHRRRPGGPRARGHPAAGGEALHLLRRQTPQSAAAMVRLHSGLPCISCAAAHRRPPNPATNCLNAIRV